MARFLGIDLTPGSLRGVLIKSAMRKTEVERYVEIPLGAPPGSPGRTPELAEAGANLLRALAVQPDVIAAAVPGEHTSLRVLDLPATARKRLAEIVPFELEAVLPFDVESAVIGFQATRADAANLHVLAAAVQRRHVLAVIEELRGAGLEPTELATGAAAFEGLVHIVPELQGSEHVLVIDIDAERSEVCQLQGGRCVAGRTLAVGLSAERDTSAELGRELQRTLAGFRATELAAPRTVYVCGGMASADGLTRWLHGLLGLEIKHLTLPAAAGATGSAGTLPPSLGFARAAALAARGLTNRPRIDLRTGDLAATHKRVRLADHANLAITCAVVVVLSAMFSLKARETLLLEEQDALRNELQTVTKDLLGESMDDAYAVKERIENPKSRDPLPRFDAFDALAAVSGSIPAELKHDIKRIRIDVAQDKHEGRLELQGALDSLGSRDAIVAQLESQGCFRDIQLGKTSPVAGQTTISYQLEATVQCPGEGPAPKKKGASSAKGEL